MTTKYVIEVTGTAADILEDHEKWRRFEDYADACEDFKERVMDIYEYLFHSDEINKCNVWTTTDGDNIKCVIGYPLSRQEFGKVTLTAEEMIENVTITDANTGEEL